MSEFLRYLQSSLINILKSDYAIILFTSLITTYLSHLFIAKREKKRIARNQIAEISGLLYLIRMTFYERYEAELYSNYYEKRAEITKKHASFDKEQEMLQNNIMRQKSEHLYTLYKELHTGITKLREVKKLSKSTEENISNILNYKTLFFMEDYKKIKTIQELEEYKKNALQDIKEHIKKLKVVHDPLSNLES